MRKDELTRALAETDSILRLARCLWMVRLPGSITPEQLEALRHIGKHAPVGASALAHLAGISPSSMSLRASVLVRKGFVRRQPDKVDRRAVLLSLTARGRRLVHRANRLLIQRTTLALQGLSKKEAELLPRLVGKLKAVQESKD